MGPTSTPLHPIVTSRLDPSTPISCRVAKLLLQVRIKKSGILAIRIGGGEEFHDCCETLLESFEGGTGMAWAFSKLSR